MSVVYYCWFIFLCNFMRAATCDASSIIGVHSSTKCINTEREALLQFKSGIQHDHCGLLSSWEGQGDCCRWRGIRCNNHSGHVTVLHLRGLESSPCLEGKMDSSLFELKYLKYLDLSMNIFLQTIPKSIDSLTHLKRLNLSNAGIFRDFPTQLGNLSKLQYLDMKCDPRCFKYATNLQWLSHLNLLKYIDLSYVNLRIAKNWVHIVNNLPFLEVLHLDWCHLSPTVSLPLSYNNASTTVRVVSLSNNALNDSSIFQWLFNLIEIGNKLEYLDLSNNSLSGSLSSAFGKHMNSLSNLTSLRVLYLDQNQFSGVFPKFLSNFCDLQHLDISNNNFADDMSIIIQTLSNIQCANMPLLESLDLSRNQFWGSIPEKINSFSSMRELYVNGNQLNGTISPHIGQLSTLEKVSVSNNSLEGTLNESHFYNLSRLHELDMSDNPAIMIKFNDDNWIPPFKLQIIDLRYCMLGPYFPKWLLTQANFSYLDISNAQISGNIPTVFLAESLSFKLRYFNLSHNQINGVLPDMSTILGIAAIDLSSNNFEGPIHSFFGAYSSLILANDSNSILCEKFQRWPYIRFIDLSNNKLSGELPDCWMQFDGLTSLHLENNQFSGKIPASFGSLTKLQYLNLRNNSFSGELPVSLRNCRLLIILNMGYNSLFGYLPSWLGHYLKGLRVLNLRGNKFSGNITSGICQLSKLQILDLASNNISGTIPKCVGNLRAMRADEPNHISQSFIEYNSTDGVALDSEVIDWKRAEQRFGSTLRLVKAIDLASNVLEGRIPSDIYTLDGLKSLNLSRNRLTGGIVSNIGLLENSLEALDLSNNHLTGEIPDNISSLHFLEVLDLSNNNFSGSILAGGQLDTFDNSSLGGLARPRYPSQGGDGEGGNTTQMVIEHKHINVFKRLCISMVVGFIIGLSGVGGTIVLKRSWRNACFEYFEKIKHKPHFMAVMNLARAWSKH